MTSSFREIIEGRIEAVLIGATSAGSNVGIDRDVTTDPKLGDSIDISTWNESASLVSRAGTDPRYDNTLQVQVLARLERKTLAAARLAIKTMVDQIKTSVLQAESFWANSRTNPGPQRVPAFQVQLEFIGSRAQHVAEATIVFHVEYSDLYHITPQDDLTLVAASVVPSQHGQPSATARPYSFLIGSDPLLTESGTGARREAGGPLIAEPAAVKPLCGALRWDAWYAPADALTQAVAADLSPDQFHDRAPFFANVTEGAVAFPAATQAVLDTECDLAVSAGLDYWAFVAYPASSPRSVAFNLYLSSTHAKPKFALVQSLADIWNNNAPLPEMDTLVGRVSNANNVKVHGRRPLIYLLDDGADDFASRYGSTFALAAAVNALRTGVQTLIGLNPYIVLLAAWPERGATLMEAGFDGLGMYIAPVPATAPTDFSALADSAEAWWAEGKGLGFDFVPTAMTGWDPRPRILTPNALFGDDTSLPAEAYYLPGTASEIAAHVAACRNFTAANRVACPANTFLVYAWNEFDEGGWICPTWLAGNTEGDTARVAALAAQLNT